MKKILPYAFLLAALWSQKGAAQVVNSPSPVRSVSDTNPNTSNPFAVQQQHTATIGSTGVGPATNLYNSGRNDLWRASGWTSGGVVNNDAYFYWTVQPARGTVIPGGNLHFSIFRNEAGPRSFSLRSSLDSFASDISQGIISGNAARVSIPIAIPDSLLSADSPITFRLHAYNARADFGTLTLSDLGYGGAELPVSAELYDFRASGDENGAVLRWKTAYESGLSRYEVERSEDGKIYQVIGTVPIRNERENAYQYEDLKPYRTRNFYRLAVVDMAGTRNLSRAVLVSGSPITTLEGPLTATPNPMTGSELTINHPVAKPGALLKITDVAGQEIYAAAAEEGAILTTIQNLSLDKGSYYLTMENGDERYSTILVK